MSTDFENLLKALPPNKANAIKTLMSGMPLEEQKVIVKTLLGRKKKHEFLEANLRHRETQWHKKVESLSPLEEMLLEVLSDKLEVIAEDKENPAFALTTLFLETWLRIEELEQKVDKEHAVVMALLADTDLGEKK